MFRINKLQKSRKFCIKAHKDCEARIYYVEQDLETVYQQNKRQSEELNSLKNDSFKPTFTHIYTKTCPICHKIGHRSSQCLQKGQTEMERRVNRKLRDLERKNRPIVDHDNDHRFRALSDFGSTTDSEKYKHGLKCQENLGSSSRAFKMIRYHLPIYTNASTDSVLTYEKGKERTKGYVQIIKQNKWVRLKTIDLYTLPGKILDILPQYVQWIYLPHV